MTKTPLQRAIDCLRIKDVYLHASQCRISGDFEPEFNTEPLMVQFMHVVTKSNVFEAHDTSDENKKLWLFRVFIDVGSRWVWADGDEVGSGEDASDVDDGIKEVDVDELAKIEATFVAEYWLTEEPGKDALDAFALQNASFHVWPYWREYLMSQCMRMNLPKVTLPAVQIATNNNAKEPSTDESSEVASKGAD